MMEKLLASYTVERSTMTHEVLIQSRRLGKGKKQQSTINKESIILPKNDVCHLHLINSIN